jgi:hypothetical protein
MTIDLERLAVDLDYWDEVAPEGASHLLNHDCFVKWVDGKEYNFKYKVSVNWKLCNTPWPLERYKSYHFTPVTDKPAAREWDGEGLPPVGIICDVWHLKKTWRRAGIVAHVMSVEGEKAVWQLVDYSEWSGDLEDKFRPIRSQAEREREAVIIAALRAADPPADDEIHPRQYLIDSLDILYNAGMLRMPDEDVAKKRKR